VTSPSDRPRAAVVGTGLIGASIGLALRARGWAVTGRDIDQERSQRALEAGALDAVGDDAAAEVTFVATPVAAVASEARRALALAPPSAVVTDVAGVKSAVVSAVEDPRFVGGHPMAGSEQEGLDGADAELFQGATWVLTPTERTNPASYMRLRTILTGLGAEVVALEPERHDELVAVVSHVPHLAAATLMGMAADGAEEHRAMLRLAAGGFRDMTRVAAGDPAIWPDICVENTGAIVSSLDRLLVALEEVRDLVAKGDRTGLLEVLRRARAARRSLPTGALEPGQMAELRVPVPDRPGVLAEVTTLASELGANISDMEIAHSVEGDSGVLVMVVPAADAPLLRDALAGRGFKPSVRSLE
jgi:prephenate dehydrogenase